ncbi:replication initiator 1-like isoform X5 [Lineus longissimus]
MNDVLVKLEPTSDVEHKEEVSFTSVPADVAVNPGKPGLFTCPACSQSFKTKSSLHYHQRKYRHCGMEPFACALCGKEFGIATHLTSHMRTHTKQRPFFCPLKDCDRVYSRIDLVNVHLIKCHKINYKVKKCVINMCKETFRKMPEELYNNLGLGG